MPVYPVELRSKVVADLALGLSVRQVAAKHHVARGTVQSWRDQALANGTYPRAGRVPIERPDPRPAGESRDLGEWIAAYVAAVFRAITAEADLLADPEWLRLQPPEFVLHAHNDLSDRAARIVATASFPQLEEARAAAGAGGPALDLAGVPAAGVDTGPARGDLPGGVAP